MSLTSFIRKQFIDVIEWDNAAENLLMWRFPMQDNEIQNGAQLTVRDGQVAIFVNEGTVADVFGPGQYTLNTQNLPLLTNLKNWDKFFESPFKSDVVFVSTRLQMAKRWGTSQPVTIRDAEFGIIRLRAFGMYAYQISDPKAFYSEITSSVASYTSDVLETQLRNILMANFSSGIAGSQIPFLDLAANQVIMADKIKAVLEPEFERFGVQLDTFVIENLSLPEKLQETLDKRISMGLIGDMNTYMQYQTAESIPLAAQNEGGIAGIGAGMAAGMGMGNMMTGAMGGMGAQMAQQQMAQQQMAQQQQMQMNQMAQPMQTPQAPQEDHMAKLTQLKQMLDNELISQADYDTAKQEVLKKLSS